MRCRHFGWMVLVQIGVVLGATQRASAQVAAETWDALALEAVRKVPESQEALSVFRTGDLDGTFQRLERLAAKHPELPPPKVVMAAWLLEIDQPAMARNALQQAVLDKRDDPEAYLALGEIALRGRQLAEAELLFAKANELLQAAKIAPQRLPVLKRRALAGLVTVADTRRDWLQAEKHLQSLLADDPNNAAALEQLGRVLFQQKKPAEALERLRQAARLDRTVLAPEAILAQLYQQSGDIQNAHKWMAAAINANPRDARVRVAAAQWSYEVGRLEEAETQAKAAVQLDPDSFGANLYRGLIATARKDYPTAEQFLQKAHLRSPANMTAITSLALALAEQQSPAKRRLALDYAQVASRLYPDESEAAAALGRVLYRLGRLDEAESALRRAVSVLRPTPQTLYFYARLLADRGRPEEARKLLQTPPMQASVPSYLDAELRALREELDKKQK